VSDPQPFWVYPGEPPPPPPPKFQHTYGLPILLFVLTAISTTFFTYNGPWYAFAILMILGAHEFGHYFACRWHNVDCTLPFFIPAPILPLTGTLGAVIRIREPFPSRRALFDIGVAGPIAGFITLIPFLIIGIYLSTVDVAPPGSSPLWLGEPMLFKWLARMIHGPLLEGTDIFIHPLGFAAWFGMLATALNLLPFGQLDGGHIAYAVLGPRARYLSMTTLAVVVVMVWFSYSWIVMAVMLSAMAYFMGFRHPAPLDDWTPLNKGRIVVALIALAILIGCFTPEPITINF
jgi:membrane-associated protease RseP (regulator of RpoE activity)